MTNIRWRLIHLPTGALNLSRISAEYAPPILARMDSFRSYFTEGRKNLKLSCVCRLSMVCTDPSISKSGYGSILKPLGVAPWVSGAYRVGNAIMSGQLPDGAASTYVPEEDLAVAAAGSKPAAPRELTIRHRTYKERLASCGCLKANRPILNAWHSQHQGSDLRSLGTESCLSYTGFLAQIRLASSANGVSRRHICGPATRS